VHRRPRIDLARIRCGTCGLNATRLRHRFAVIFDRAPPPSEHTRARARPRSPARRLAGPDMAAHRMHPWQSCWKPSST
jgi:hypothetical protein